MAPTVEFLCETKSVVSFADLTSVLNDYAKNGWEAISVGRPDNYRLYFEIVLKRTVPKPAPSFVYVE